MLDADFILNNADAVREAVAKKHSSLDVDALLAAIRTRREQLQAVEALRARRNEIAASIASLQGAERDAAIAAGKALKAELEQAEAALAPAEAAYTQLMLQVPNIPSDKSPLGASDADNVTLKEVGEKPQFGFAPRGHADILEGLGMLDTERGTKVHGFRGYFLQGDIVLVEQAILNMALQLMRQDGFTLVRPPVVVREQPLYATGHFPGARDEVYAIANTNDEPGKQGDPKYLAGTAEVPLLSYHAGEILEESQLPVLLCGISPCYRSEVGSYGKDTRGIYRVHEFQKAEQVVLTRDDLAESEAMFGRILGNAEKLLQALQLPYRVVANSTGDMGTGKYYMNDIEVWMPGRDGWGETHSCSNLTQWQARRAGIRYRDAEGRIRYPHCLNNTVVASPRILIALVENYQQEDGSVLLPPALAAMLPFDRLVRR